jgi:hypothetical protein
MSNLRCSGVYGMRGGTGLYRGTGASGSTNLDDLMALMRVNYWCHESLVTAKVNSLP